MNWWRFVFFMCGQLGIMMLARFFFQWLLTFSSQPVSGIASETLFLSSQVGLTLLLFRVFDGITDPIAGILGDWWSRKGKERRYLLLPSAVLPPIGLILVFSPDATHTMLLRWLLLTGGMFVFFVGYTFYLIPYLSLVEDYSLGKERNRSILSSLVGLGLMLASMVAALTSDLITEFGYYESAAGFGVVAFVLMLLPFFAAPKGKAATEENVNTEAAAPLLTAFKESFQDTRFLSLIMLFAGSQMSLTIMTAAAPFIAVGILQGTEGDVKYLLGPLLLASLPVFFVTPLIAKNFGWERPMVIASLLLAVTYGVSAFLGATIIGTPLITAGLLFLIAGPWIAILLGLESEAITNCANAAGVNRTSMYFGVFNFLVKILNGVAILISGILVDLSAKDKWGTGAIYAMPLTATGCLLIGTSCYWLLGRRAKSRQEDNQ